MGDRTSFTAPFPYYGGKAAVASEIWARLGSPKLYIEPFAGSLACLLRRPGWRPGVLWVETVNDVDALLVNAWRAIKLCPDDVAAACDWPVSEIDLHARHQWLIEHAAERAERLIADPMWCDPQAAGWWIWGSAAWLGGGWCRSSYRRRPQINGHRQGVGVHARRASGLPQPGDEGPAALRQWMARLAQRLRKVRVLCGDWTRVLSDSSLYAGTRAVTGVLLDPPYDRRTGRCRKTYRCEKYNTDDVRAWAREHGHKPRLRIALCGLAGEHDDLEADGWSRLAWRSGGSSKHTPDEVVWFSPHCLDASAPLFAGLSESFQPSALSSQPRTPTAPRASHERPDDPDQADGCRLTTDGSQPGRSA